LRASTVRGQPGAVDDVIDSPTGRWMLAALERLELLVPLDDVVSLVAVKRMKAVNEKVIIIT
jgi:hypothetical protein